VTCLTCLIQWRCRRKHRTGGGSRPRRSSTTRGGTTLGQGGLGPRRALRCRGPGARRVLDRVARCQRCRAVTARVQAGTAANSVAPSVRRPQADGFFQGLRARDAAAAALNRRSFAWRSFIMPVLSGGRRAPARPVRPSFRDPRFVFLLAGQSVNGAARSLCSPASSALPTRVVESGDLLAANPLLGVTGSIGQVAGPLAASVLIATTGFRVAFAADAATYLVGVLVMLPLPLLPLPAEPDPGVVALAPGRPSDLHVRGVPGRRAALRPARSGPAAVPVRAVRGGDRDRGDRDRPRPCSGSPP
jgi:hypothetical protein